MDMSEGYGTNDRGERSAVSNNTGYPGWILGAGNERFGVPNPEYGYWYSGLFNPIRNGFGGGDAVFRGEWSGSYPSMVSDIPNVVF